MPNKFEDGMNKELQFHLDQATADYIAQGLSPTQARREAMKDFGTLDLAKEELRDTLPRRWLSDLTQDLRYCLRGFARTPGFAVFAILSLALGIGANTAVFSTMYTVMLKPLAVSRPEELVSFVEQYPGEPRVDSYPSWASFEHYRDRNHVFSQVTGVSFDNIAPLVIDGLSADTVKRENVTGNYFRFLGLRPAAGRLFDSSDVGADGKGSVAVLSWSYWNSRLQSAPEVIGKRVILNGTPLTIVGIAPQSYSGPRSSAATDIWVPNEKDPVNVIARLKPGVKLEQARAEMAVLFRFALEQRFERSKDGNLWQTKMEVVRAATGLSTARNTYGRPLVILMLVVGAVLLLACVNIGGMLVARGADRSREFALRVALGAGSGRLARLLLTEAMLLAVAGAVSGTAVAYVGTRALVRLIASARPAERVELNVQTDTTLLAFSIVLTLLTGLLFGLAPALMALRAKPVASLRQSGASVSSRRTQWFSKALVVTQVALSVVLLGSGALFIQHLASLQGTDLGFRRDHVLIVAVNTASTGLRGQALSDFYQETLHRVAAIPGVRLASLGTPTPLMGAGASAKLVVDGFVESAEQRPWLSLSWVAPRYFEALGTPLLAGRDFTPHDQADPSVAIISRSLAQRYFAGRDPLGKRITLEHITGRTEPSTRVIIGVAADSNYMFIREPERRSVYLPALLKGGVVPGSLVIRTEVRPESIVNAVRGAVSGVAPMATVAGATTLSDQIDATVVPERLMANLSGFFAAIGGLLAGIGIYWLLAHSVTRRTNEIGIRMALGASSAGIIRMVLEEALLIVSLGLIVGIPLAVWGQALATSLMSDLSPHTLPLVIGAAGIMAITLVAAFLPARAASHVDPMKWLRHD